METPSGPPVCTQCFEPVPNVVCPRCGLHSQSMLLDPMNALGAYGRMFRRGAGKPEKLTLAGIWLIFLPSLLAGLAAALAPLSATARIVPVILVLLSGAILIRATRNFRKRQSGRGRKEDGD